jgi:glycerol-3-phosphate dehydrogenase
MIKTDVIIIGGGATGCGIARDLALRGIPHCLIEKGDYAAGATGACHGLLHSGGRYVVSDAIAAKECYDENMILRRIGEKCVEPTGGLFVRLTGDSKIFRERFLRSCEEIGIPTEIMSSTKARSSWCPISTRKWKKPSGFPIVRLIPSAYACST